MEDRLNDKGGPPLVRLSDTGRLETLSDGVFSVTITLLLYELTRPEYTPGHLLESLLGQWSTYIAFLASFLYTGVIWLNHRAVYGRVRYSNIQLHWANLILLLTSALIPFPTAVFSTAFLRGNHFDAQVAVVLYAIIGDVMCLSWLILFHILCIHPYLLENGVEPRFFHGERIRAGVGICAYAIAGIAGWVLSPLLAVLIFLFLPIFYGVTSEGLTEGPKLYTRLLRERKRNERP